MWESIRALQGTTLRTTGQNKPFLIVRVTDGECIIKVESTGRIRPIPRRDFERAAALGPISALNTAILRAKGASEANPAYVLAILRSISS